MHNRHEALQYHFDSIEFRLEILPAVDTQFPPFFHDIRKGASGATGYRSLRHLKLENSALTENFKTLKVVTHLPGDKIILELALSQRANHEDYSSFHEQPIGTYLIGDGDTVELPELTQFGLAPMIAQAVRLTTEEVSLGRIQQVNYTTGLQIAGIQKKASVHLVTYKNISNQAICRYGGGIDMPTGGSDHFALGTVPPQAEESMLMHLQPYSVFRPAEREKVIAREQTFVIGAALYEDNTCEGQGSWLLQTLFSPPCPTPLNPKLHALLPPLHTVSEADLEAELVKVRTEMTTLLKELALPPGIKVRGKDWTEPEIYEQLALSWLRETLQKAIRTSAWMKAHLFGALTETRQAAMDKHAHRSQRILELLLTEE